MYIHKIIKKQIITTNQKKKEKIIKQKAAEKSKIETNKIVKKLIGILIGKEEIKTSKE